MPTRLPLRLLRALGFSAFHWSLLASRQPFLLPRTTLHAAIRSASPDGRQVERFGVRLGRGWIARWQPDYLSRTRVIGRSLLQRWHWRRG